MFLQHQHCLALLHVAAVVDVLSEVLLEGDDTDAYTLEMLPVDEMERYTE